MSAGKGISFVLVVGTASSGSHLTVYPMGTPRGKLIHDGTSDGVYAEAVGDEVAATVARDGLTFSSVQEFEAWQAGEGN